MKIDLSPEMERYVEEQLASGRYASADELIAEALILLRSAERELAASQDDLRSEVDAGLRDIEEGRVSPWSLQDLLQEVRAR